MGSGALPRKPFKTYPAWFNFFAKMRRSMRARVLDDMQIKKFEITALDPDELV